MNTKQLVALVVGIVAVGVTLAVSMRSQVISSRPITSSAEVIFVEDYLPLSGFLWPAAVGGLTAGVVYWLRTRRPA